MCGTMPSGHWWASSVSISVQARRLVEVALAEGGEAGIPVPLEGIEPLGGHGVGAAVVLAEDGGGAGEQGLVAGFDAHGWLGLLVGS